ncbi:hypothetical protein EAO75_04400 [Streptomyces sp. uw30]|uniref:hypothetical protein n=1 Tax=Streptomyces sp. uw30 TaxID=1828179 RepID=UPI0011CE0BE1|nr:hypothetical protein [Streptomyces sp. uw30]TXS53436.1 hypothetical protein EAO75_04400 [Streptomyces sp. uw30]
MSVGEEVRTEQGKPQQSLGTAAARNLATTGSNVRMIGCPDSLWCSVACRPGEESQQPALDFSARVCAWPS